MQRALGRTKDWTVKGDAPGLAAGGIGLTYKRARKAMRVARKRGSDEVMHEWRKRVKYHRYHAQILRS
jgi:CHAD domain